MIERSRRACSPARLLPQPKVEGRHQHSGRFERRKEIARSACATFPNRACSVGMKSFLSISLKIIIAAAIGATIIWLWPVVIIPLVLVLLAALGLLALFLVCLLVIGAVGGGVVVGLLALAAGLLALLSPLWIPAALVLGIIWLVKRLGASKSPSPVAA
jgi:hypothetical protein